MKQRVKIPCIFGTSLLEAKDFTVDPDLTGKPAPVISMSLVAALHVIGRVNGPPGHFAFFAFSVNAFNNDPGVPYSYFSEALMIPCGESFEFFVDRGQTVYALGSISPYVAWGNPGTLVYVTYNATFVEAEKIFADEEGSSGGDPDAGGSEGKLVGPGLIFRKR